MDTDQVYARYYNLSLRYLSYRPRSEKEVSDYLKEKAKRAESLTPEIIDQIITKLKAYKFIDDQAFIKFWFESRTKFKRKPLKVVRFELTQKGIKRSLIDDYLEDLEESLDLDLENAKSLAKKKMEFYRNIDPKKRNEKVMRYLIGKGFSYDVVKKVIKD